MRNARPSMFFKIIMLLLSTASFVFSTQAQQQDNSKSSPDASRKASADKRSDSQKSYIPPRTRDAQRNSPGNNQVARPSDKKEVTKVTTEKKNPVRK